MNILQNSVHFHIDAAMSSQSLFNWKTLSFWKISYVLKIMFVFELILWQLIYYKSFYSIAQIWIGFGMVKKTFWIGYLNFHRLFPCPSDYFQKIAR